jgi:hypothetical protein
MNYAYCKYTSLCDRTNTRRLNWADILSFLSVQLSRAKRNLIFPLFSLRSAVSLNEVTGQLTEWVGSTS